MWIRRKQKRSASTLKILFSSIISVQSAGWIIIKRNELEVVYHIASYDHPVVLTLKAVLPRENPEIESIVSVYWGANWYERETYELFGIFFKNHPNLKPLVLPEDMLGEWPLRKDYKGFPNQTARNLV